VKTFQVHWEGESNLNKFLLFIALASLAGLAVGANAGTEAVIKADAAAIQPAGKALEVVSSEHAAANPSGAKVTSSGKVLEVIDSPMYTYLKVTGDKGPLWLAAYKTDITKGSTVKYSGVPMQNFFSKSLNRTFDLIIFVEGLELVME
jgi:hypothetical protein